MSSIVVAQTTSLFTVEIRHAILPQNFKIPYIEHYKGRIDPLEFEAADDSIMCRAFQLTLRGAAKAWFTNLRSKSIESFKQL